MPFGSLSRNLVWSTAVYSAAKDHQSSGRVGDAGGSETGLQHTPSHFVSIPGSMPSSNYRSTRITRNDTNPFIIPVQKQATRVMIFAWNLCEELSHLKVL